MCEVKFISDNILLKASSKENEYCIIVWLTMQIYISDSTSIRMLTIRMLTYKAVKIIIYLDRCQTAKS